MELQKLPEQIVDSIISPELGSIASELSEVGLDQLLDEGFIKDLPVVGLIVKIFKAGLDIRDRIFVAKVAKFLFKLAETPEKHRSSFEEKVRNDPNLKKKVGQTLVLLLERLDDLEKPDMVGICFRYYLSSKISFIQFRRLSSAIDLAFIDDLKELVDFKVERSGFIDVKESLARTGLVRFHGSDVMGRGKEIVYVISPLGQLFLSIMTDNFDQSIQI